MADDIVRPTRQALVEALGLSEVILKNIELSELPLANIALKASRLARLMNDSKYQKIMEYEVSGYPSPPDGVPVPVWELAVEAGRKYDEKDATTDAVTERIYITSLEQLELDADSLALELSAAKDPNVSLSSANPHQFVHMPAGNAAERAAIRRRAATAKNRLSSRRSFIYADVLRRNHELKFSGIADDIFSRIRENVDSSIGKYVPEAVTKLTAVYVNLQSENTEDWSNAVHSCRRILQDLADSLYPSRPDVEKIINNKPKTISLGPDAYINRIIAFLEEKSSSARFNEIVGSNLEFMGDRLDSVFRAAQKGSHANIVTRAEADRYVVYTYLIVGDVLSLL